MNASPGSLVPRDFQRGLIYTVHPRILAPLVAGEQYRILASTRILLQRDQQLPSYEPLYRRARLLASRRARELSCESASDPPGTWVLSHGWFRMDISVGAIAGAAVMLGVCCGTMVPRGRDEPSSDALTLPYTPDMVAESGLRDGTWDEFYNDFDMRSPEEHASSDVTVSYGEYVFSRNAIDVDALISRAERRARSYFGLVDPAGDITLISREWTCLDTGKASRPLLAHVMMQFSS